jgi:uncharacterized membrane protein
LIDFLGSLDKLDCGEQSLTMKILLVIAGCVFIAFGITLAIYHTPPKTSGDFAAWVQAVGSVVAILVAATIANNESAQARKIKERDRNDLYRSMVGIAAVAATAFVDCAKHIASTSTAEMLDILIPDSRLAAAVDMLHEIKATDLPSGEAVQSLFTLRFLLTSIRNEVNGYRAQHGILVNRILRDPDEAKEQFSKLRQELERAAGRSLGPDWEP